MNLRVQIWRQSAANQAGHWEVFASEVNATHTVRDVLNAIAANPVTVDGKRTSAVEIQGRSLDGTATESSVLANGIPVVPSRALAAEFGPILVLSPFTKFPILRDLAVDLTAAGQSVRSILATAPEAKLPACSGCGACLEACPQYSGAAQGFVGAAALFAVAALEAVPAGKEQRLEAMLGPGGVAVCGNAQTCVEVCPAGLDLATSIGRVKRAAVGHWIWGLFSD